MRLLARLVLHHFESCGTSCVLPPKSVCQTLDGTCGWLVRCNSLSTGCFKGADESNEFCALPGNRFPVQTVTRQLVIPVCGNGYVKDYNYTQNFMLMVMMMVHSHSGRLANSLAGAQSCCKDKSFSRRCAKTWRPDITFEKKSFGTTMEHLANALVSGSQGAPVENVEKRQDLEALARSRDPEKACVLWMGRSTEYTFGHP